MPGSTGQETPTRTGVDEEVLRRLVPPHRVVLHNDDVNSMDHVVAALQKSVPQLSAEEAVEIMLEAHSNGRATVITCSREEAELYRDRLESHRLTVTIEAA